MNIETKNLKFLIFLGLFQCLALKLEKAGFGFSGFEWLVLDTGSLVAFIVSIFAIKLLLNYIKKLDFKIFDYYRIILGIIVLVYFYIL